MLGRVGIFAAAILAAAVMMMSVSIVPSLSGSVEASTGRPLAGAYLAYSYRGSRFNFVDSLSYERPGAVLRTDNTGAYHVAGFLQVHKPLDGGLKPWIDWLYAPELHHAFGPIGRLSESQPGVIEVDWAKGLVQLADLTEDPERWSRTIELLHREAKDDEARAEYLAFLERHRETAREMPDAPHLRYLPPAEREARLTEIRQALEREPLWGPYMERRWRNTFGPTVR